MCGVEQTTSVFALGAFDVRRGGQMYINQI